MKDKSNVPPREPWAARVYGWWCEIGGRLLVGPVRFWPDLAWWAAMLVTVPAFWVLVGVVALWRRLRKVVGR